MSFAVWLTGLSGSGKSAIARELLAQLHVRGVDAAVLESDIMRTQLTPYPRYDEQDRDFFYEMLSRVGVLVVESGRPVVLDATANLRRYRDAARSRIARFAEVYVDTPLEVCRARDTKGLYKGDGKNLPGVGALYEPPLKPEVVVHGGRGTPAQAAAAILSFLEKQFGV
ncbi:MAG TPA: adenylyl-sulfate kinase [Burkholderiales bacterium]|nr:adenylyl-sulfate kinase [Burkholderiales bacterium]